MDNFYKPGAQPVFATPEEVAPRPWGREELLVLIPGKLMLKRLTIFAGSKGGLQYHRKKDECGLLLSGRLLVRYEDGLGGLTERILLPGACFHFPTGVLHQEEALEDCVIIEGSTPHFDDRVRMEAFFGLGEPMGLPSTPYESIVEK